LFFRIEEKVSSSVFRVCRRCYNLAAKTVLQVVIGGGIVFAIGIWLGKIGAG
jgi:hypothetical protein